MLDRRALVALAALAACNKPPEGLEVALGPESPTSVDDLVLDVVSEATDPNGRDIVALEVTWSVDGSVVPDLADTLIVPASRTSAGETWSASVVATDGRDPAEAIDVSITVVNTAPVMELSVRPKGSTDTDTRLEASVVSTDDLDGDEVTVRWSWTVDGVDAGIDTPIVPKGRTSKGETWTVTATPTDGVDDGEPVQATISIVNTPPSVGAARVDPQRVYEATTVSCRGGGWSDPDGDAEAYTTVWFVNGSRIGESDTLDGSSWDRGDTVRCRLTPFDGEETGAPIDSATIDVRNTPAGMLDGTLTPEEPDVTDTLQARPGVLIDDDGDFVVVKYRWWVNDVEVDNAASFIRASDGWYGKGDQVRVWMRAYDGIEVGTGPAVEVTIRNAPPEAPEARIVVDGDQLVCEVITPSVDADDDIVTYSMSWSVDGTAWTGGTTTSTWPDDQVALADTSPGETWTCVVSPDDGEDVGTADSVSVDLSEG